jgi:hypothetical protein
MILKDYHMKNSWRFSGTAMTLLPGHGRGNTERRFFIMMKNRKRPLKTP